MQLQSFRVRKFRNIVDSGEILVDPDVTCFVGKNEAGKSGLLEALYLLRPAYKDKFDAGEQYPRWLVTQDRKRGDLGDATPITATFELNDDDVAVVEDELGKGVLVGTALQLSRDYDDSLLFTLPTNEAVVVEYLRQQLPAHVATYCKDIASLEALRAVAPAEDGLSKEDAATIKAVLRTSGLEQGALRERVWALVEPRIPTFFRFTEYSGLAGRVDLRELATASEGPGRSRLQTARALLALAGTDTTLLANEEYEVRKAELEAVQIDLTRQVFSFWKQNPHLEVLIDIDKATQRHQNGTTSVARYLDIRLRDRRTGYSNNFSQRSSGFQWFFSFLAAFSEFESHDVLPIVLLDEPALTLHGKAQGDFLRFINERLAPVSMVLYTTHSPFMIEADHLERVRVVEDRGPPDGAMCSTEVLASDPDSLFPLQAALGYDIAQTLFVGPHNLVIEGTSDFIYLTTLSQACAASGRTALDSRWRLLPAGGATNIPTFVSLIGPHLDVTVLADADTQNMQRVMNMVSQNLLKGHRLVMASAASVNKDADIEDLFSDGDYLMLYNQTFKASLKVAELPAGSRIVKRIEAHAGKFVHGQVAETLLRQPGIKLTNTTLDHFAALFAALNATLGT